MLPVVVILSSLTGCYATKVVRSTDLAPDAAAPGLMVSTIVETYQSNSSGGGTTGLVQAIVDVANNSELASFGETVQPEVSAWLTTQGVAQTSDKDRVMGDKATDWGKVANDFTVLSGTWVDPDGLALRVATDTLFSAGTFKDVGSRLAGTDPKETYVYTTVTVVPLTEWLVVGTPRVRVSVVAHDRDGKELLRARAWGVGKRTAFVVDRSPASLTRGFQEAMAKLASAEVEASAAK